MFERKVLELFDKMYPDQIIILDGDNNLLLDRSFWLYINDYCKSKCPVQLIWNAELVKDVTNMVKDNGHIKMLSPLGLTILSSTAFEPYDVFGFGAYIKHYDRKIIDHDIMILDKIIMRERFKEKGFSDGEIDMIKYAFNMMIEDIIPGH